ncbi:MAG: hypothetical protein KBS59_00320 [Clostridiales bacterium]|nr:hypothetical protein [Clostridiales bacterium]
MIGVPLSEKDIAYIIENRHRKHVEIAKEMGISNATVTRVLKAYKKGIIIKPKERYHGCDRNCYNCPYHDCLAPQNVACKELNIDEYITMVDGIRETLPGSPNGKKKPKYHKNKSLVMCVETGKIYKTAKAAADDVGTVPSAIVNCLHKRQQTSMKLHWKYVEDEK